MLLRHRPPELDDAPATLAPGLEHLDQRWVAVLRWLNANKVGFVLVGPVARAIRGELGPAGAVAIVPAPYLRNYERLAAGLVAGGAALRSERPAEPRAEQRFTAEGLARGRRWLLRVGGHELDIESSGARARPGATGDGVRYQELLYESARVRVAEGVSVEVAAPEDLEHYSHVRRTGVAPEFRVSRAQPSRDAAPYGVDAESA